MGTSCVYRPCVRNKVDKNGNHPISKFFSRADKLFGYDAAKAMYAAVNSEEFAKLDDGSLERDENGEVTLEAYLRAIGETADSQKLLDSMNEEYGSGIYDYATAESKVAAFNQAHPFDSALNRYMATMQRTSSGKYFFSITKKSAEGYEKLEETIVQQKILEKIVARLKSMGIDVSFITKAEDHSRYSTENARKTADGLWALVQLSMNESTTEEAAEEAGHFAMAAFKDNSITQRLETLLQDEELQKTLIKQLGIEDQNLGSNPARELAGRLIGKGLLKGLRKEVQQEKGIQSETEKGTETKGYQRLVDRFVSFIRSFFNKFKNKITGNDIINDVTEAENLADTIANGFIYDPSSMSIDQALANKETLYHNDPQKAKIDGMQRVDDIAKLALSVCFDVNDCLGKVRDSINAVIEKGAIQEFEDNQTLFQMKSLAKKVKKKYEEYELKYENGQINDAAVASTITADIIQSLLNIVIESQSEMQKILRQIHSNFTFDMFVEQMYAYAKFAQLCIELGKTISIITKSSIFLSNVASAFGDIGSDLVNNFNTLIRANSSFQTTTLIFVRELDIQYLEDINGSPSLHIAHQRLNRTQKAFFDGMIEHYDTLCIDHDSGWSVIKKREKKEVKWGSKKKPMECYVTVYTHKTGYADGDGNEILETKTFYETDNGYFTDDVDMSISDFLDNLFVDQNWFSAWLGSMDNSDEVNQLVYRAYKKAKYKGDQEMNDYWQQLSEMRDEAREKFGSDNRWMFAKVENAKGGYDLTGNLVFEFDMDKYDDGLEEFKNKKKKEFINSHKELYDAYQKDELSEYAFSIAWSQYWESSYKKWLRDEVDFLDDKDTYFGMAYVPKSKYKSNAWEQLSEEQKEFMNKYFELKSKIDKMLPDGCNHVYRAPQFRASFITNIKNQGFAKTGNLGTRIGRALRTKLADEFFASQWDTEFGGDLTVVDPKEHLFKEHSSFYEASSSPIMNLPLYGIRKMPKEQMNSLSTDIFATTLRYAAMATNYNTLAEHIDSFENIRYQINGVRKLKYVGFGYTAEDVEKKGYMSRCQRRFMHFMERQVYGKDGWKKNLKIAWYQLLFKSIGHLTHLASVLTLGGNVRGGIVNTLTGHNELVKEAYAGEFFTNKDLWWAEYKYGKKIGKNLMNVGSDHKVDFISSFARKFDVINENRYSYGQWKTEGGMMRRGVRRVTRTMNKSIMWPYHNGDHWMQSMTFLAMGHHQKLYKADGKQTNMIDAYKADGYGGMQLKELMFKEKDGGMKFDFIKIAYELTQRTESNGGEVNPYDYWGENRKEQLTEYLKEYAYVSEEKINNATAYEIGQMCKNAMINLTWNASDEAEFALKARSVGNRMHGIYNFSDMTAMHNYIAGRCLLQMRGWLLGMLDRRIGERRFNVTLGTTVEGSWRTWCKLISSTFGGMRVNIQTTPQKKDTLLDNNSTSYHSGTEFTLNVREANDQMGLMRRLGNTAMIMFFPWVPGTRSRTEADLKARGFDDYQIANLRRSFADGMQLVKVWLFTMLYKIPLIAFFPSDDERKYRMLELMRKYKMINLENEKWWLKASASDRESAWKTMECKIDELCKKLGKDDISESSLWLEYFTEGLWVDDLGFREIFNPILGKSGPLDAGKLATRVDENSLPAWALCLGYYISMRSIAEQAIFHPIGWLAFPMGYAEAKNAIAMMTPMIFSFTSLLGELGKLFLITSGYAIAGGGTNMTFKDPLKNPYEDRGLVGNILFDFNVYNWNTRLHYGNVSRVAFINDQYDNFKSAVEARYRYKTEDDEKVKKLFAEVDKLLVSDDSWRSKKVQDLCHQINAVGKKKSKYYGFIDEKRDYLVRSDYDPDDDETISGKSKINSRMLRVKRDLNYYRLLNNNNSGPKSLQSYLEDMGTKDDLQNIIYLRNKGRYQRAGNLKLWQKILRYNPYMLIPTRLLYGYNEGEIEAYKYYEWMLEQAR